MGWFTAISLCLDLPASAYLWLLKHSSIWGPWYAHKRSPKDPIFASGHNMRSVKTLSATTPVSPNPRSVIHTCECARVELCHSEWSHRCTVLGRQSWQGHMLCNEPQWYSRFGETCFVQTDLRYEVRPLRKLNVKLQRVSLPDWNHDLQSTETPVYCKVKVEWRRDSICRVVFFYLESGSCFFTWAHCLKARDANYIWSQWKHGATIYASSVCFHHPLIFFTDFSRNGEN